MKRYSSGCGDGMYEDKEGIYVLYEEVIRLESQVDVEKGGSEEMYLNMQYYYEYCRMNDYVTPQEWVEKHKHF